MTRYRTALLLVLILVAGIALAAKPKAMSVQVQKCELRATPSRLAKVVAQAKYGDRLTVQETRGEWQKVATADGAATGWVHSTALTTKKIVLSAGSKDAQLAASSDEMAMAGKGFNSDVEKQFKDKNKDVDFTWVDKMETFVAQPEQMQQFLDAGGVTAAKGGAK